MISHGVVWTEPGAVAIEEFEVPAPGVGEIRLEAECTMISPGTERAFFLAISATPGVRLRRARAGCRSGCKGIQAG
jgi:hypothetical protein